ncbi:hypothetical protein BDK51DRAFT_32966 [Blyttiomyces helicus]|uniref:Uncharacterized protein n=1 Tax=Blyttiomyces helicus TaxID=388810 RepID=A0A4P9W8N4_9FUNG|nr:hypothetical protein BDK51DRAFT_32966 [Blyttiomyces helicus]|eukprot:RKO87438.1 hypothetical protein BDK51DRAFT_32966 [Blyttiomyces helicus]
MFQSIEEEDEIKARRLPMFKVGTRRGNERGSGWEVIRHAGLREDGDRQFRREWTGKDVECEICVENDKVRESRRYGSGLDPCNYQHYVVNSQDGAKSAWGKEEISCGVVGETRSDFWKERKRKNDRDQSAFVKEDSAPHLHWSETPDTS